MSLTELWNLRLTPETKRRWTEIAEKRGYASLSEYVRSVVTEDALAEEEGDLAGQKTCLACGNSIPMDSQTCPDCGSDQTDFVLDTGDEGEYGMSEKKDDKDLTDENSVFVGPLRVRRGMLEDDSMTAADFEGLGRMVAETADSMAVAAPETETEDAETVEPWEGVMGTIGSPTTDGRYLIPDKIGSRTLPVEFNMQPQLAEGHDGAVPIGRIDSIEFIPFAQFDRADEFYDEEQIANMPDQAVVIWGEGELNGPNVAEAKRRIANGADVSIDGLHMDGTLWDSQTYAQVDTDELGLDEILSGLATGDYLQGLSGDVGGLTMVGIGAFKEARVITASASLRVVETRSTAAERFAVLIASAGPLKPSKEWFEDPQLKKLTPLQITKEGRVFGHLADWDGCHVGFQGVCVPPFRSLSNYAYFNVGEIETADGTLVPCGKLMFSMDGGKHAPTNPRYSYQDVQRHYDDATKVGAFVRAGSDRFGTWLAGTLRPGLNDVEIQHLRAHPPSGDWRPIRGGESDLIAAFAVAVPGFPIPRGEALVASAGGDITAIITAPLELEQYPREKRRKEAMQMASERSRADIRREIAERLAHGPWNDGLDLVEIGEELAPTAEQRRAWAKSGVAMPDGSFPITKCTGDGTSAINARRAIGRAAPSKRPAVERHIASREKALGCSNDSNEHAAS